MGVPKSHQNIPKCCVPQQGSNSEKFQTFLWPAHGPLLLFQTHGHLFWLPVADSTHVGLPYPCTKLLQEAFCLLQADWSYVFGKAHVKWITALIICIIFVGRNIWLWVLIDYPCNLCVVQFCSCLNSCSWKAYKGSHREAGNWSSWSRGWSCPYNDCIVSRNCWKDSRSIWKWRSMPWELLMREHSRSTITAKGEIICLPYWPITLISLSCTRQNHPVSMNKGLFPNGMLPLAHCDYAEPSWFDHSLCRWMDICKLSTNIQLRHLTNCNTTWGYFQFWTYRCSAAWSHWYSQPNKNQRM